MPNSTGRFLNRTHDPVARSWVQSANEPDTDFPLQNLPLGVFTRRGAGERPRVGVAIGAFVLDLAACSRSGALDGEASTAAAACESDVLNDLMALGRSHWSALRSKLHDLLVDGGGAGHRHRQSIEKHLVPQRVVEMQVPARIGDYTDFYASIFHATNVGRMMRPDQPLLENYKYVPIGYHGRASSIVQSGTAVRRPRGQTKPDGASSPAFHASRRLDYELEIGVFVGPGNTLGEPIPIAEVGEHLFGVCLLNDWSARDVQRWEYQPLGPFLAKSFATSVSPWVVTMEALEPFRRPAFARPEGDPAPLDYLSDPGDLQRGGFDIVVDVYLQSAAMRASGLEPLLVSRGNLADLYWTIGQLAAHHASNGCNLRPGDLFATGTVSGPKDSSRGCLLELTSGGTRPIRLPTGEQRAFLEDGDEIVFRARAQAPDAAAIGFGECRGLIVPALR